MPLTAEKLIYLYFFICILLLAFNAVYLGQTKRQLRSNPKRVRTWSLDLLAVELGLSSPARLIRRARRTKGLLLLHEALSIRAQEAPAAVHAFFRSNWQAIRDLALVYGKRSAMERAFFAYVIASHAPPLEAERDPLVEILLGYLDGSTVYCRENVLNALYALGSSRGVEHALTIFSEQGWRHDPRLLSDGMARFAGDPSALVRRLWQHRALWLECLTAGVVRFAATLPGDGFCAPFLTALREEAPPLEVRFALVRYFQRHPDPQAEPLLLELLEALTPASEQLAPAAANVLSAYPGEVVRQALLRAMHSRNWYIRYNAAQALGRLGLSWEEAECLRADGDRYAAEMLDYAGGLAPPEEAASDSGRAVVVA